MAEIEEVPIDTLSVDSSVTGSVDKILTYLLERAFDGTLPVYQANIPLQLVKPHETGLSPQSHPGFRAIVQSITQHSQKGNNLPQIIVYPRDGHFVMSDDYPVYCAAIDLKLEAVGCIILGEFYSSYVIDRFGPIAAVELPQVFGLRA